MSTKGQSIINRPFGNHYLIVAVSACLILILMGLLSGRLEHKFDQAEQAQFDYRVTELKSAVRLMEADLISQGKLQQADTYEGANPMTWLEDDTSHYLGVMTPAKAIEHPGNWFFDVKNSAIAFVPYALNDSEKLENKDESIDKILRFKVRALRSKEFNSKYSGLVLEQLSKQEIR